MIVINSGELKEIQKISVRDFDCNYKLQMKHPNYGDEQMLWNEGKNLLLISKRTETHRHIY